MGVLAIVLAVGALALLFRPMSGHGVPAAEIGHAVSGLLEGIPQSQGRLGLATAPVTLQVFMDLKDPDSRSWFVTDLPAIVRDYVRTGRIQLQYRAYKTNTFNPAEFVREQSAALAAGNQNKLWNYICVFFLQPRRAEEAAEYETYATNAFLARVAHQVPGLNVARWQTDRHTGRREEQTTAEDQAARALQLHVTPSFRIGKTGGPFRNYSGHAIVKYGEQHPIALPEASDIAKAIEELGH